MTKKTGYQTRLAQATGFTDGYISMILSGGRRITLWATAVTFAQATGTRPELWLEGKPGDLRHAARQAFGHGEV